MYQKFIAGVNTALYLCNATSPKNTSENATTNVAVSLIFFVIFSRRRCRSLFSFLKCQENSYIMLLWSSLTASNLWFTYRAHAVEHCSLQRSISHRNLRLVTLKTRRALSSQPANALGAEERYLSFFSRKVNNDSSVETAAAEDWRKSTRGSVCDPKCDLRDLWSKLWGSRSRLYRSRFLQSNTRWKALDEIYQIDMPLHRSTCKISAIVH